MSRWNRGSLVACLALVASVALAQDAQFEPNQSRRAAAKIEPGSYGGLVCDGEDWYALALKPGQRLVAQALFRHADGDLDIGLYDARGRVAGYSRGTGGTEVVGYTSEAEAPLFVRVFGETNRYALKLEVSDVGPMTATGWALKGCGNEWLACAVAATDAVRCRATVADGQVATVLIRDADANELAISEPGATTEVSFAVPEEARLLVHVLGEPGELQLTVSVGSPVPEDLKRVLGKVREDGAGNDLLELTNGDTLKGKVVTAGFPLRAIYGDLSLPVDNLAGIDFGTPSRPLQRVACVDGSRFSGILGLETLAVELDGEALAIPVERVRRVVFGRRGKECEGLRSRRMLVLRNDDRFSCSIEGLDPSAAGDPAPGWTLTLGFGKRTVVLDRLAGIKVVSADEAKLERVDGGSLRGRLDREYVNVELDLLNPAGEEQPLRIHLGRVSDILPRALEGAGRGSDLEFTFDGADIEGWDAMTDGNSSWSRVNQGENNGCLHAGGANGGNYADNAGIFATSPLLPIEGLEAPVLSLRARYQLEDGADFVAVLVSYDEGQTFVEMHRFSGTQPWTEVQLPLEQGSGVMVRFALLSDASVNGPGAWVDDVKISEGGE